jgi:hypothetical protein
VLLLLLQVRGKLTPARTADLLAVAFNMAIDRRPVVISLILRDDCGASDDATFDNIDNTLMSPSPHLSPAGQLPAAAVQALLWLLLQLHARHNKPELTHLWPMFVGQLCGLPCAAQLPAATVVQLAQQALQSPGTWMPELTARMLQLLTNSELTAEQLKELLSLLRGPTAAAAARAFQSVMPDRRTVMLWLARQPGAAAAAAELGLTAADLQQVRDPAAAQLLFGSQAAGTAGGATDTDSVSESLSHNDDSDEAVSGGGDDSDEAVSDGDDNGVITSDGENSGDDDCDDGDSDSDGENSDGGDSSAQLHGHHQTGSCVPCTRCCVIVFALMDRPAIE